MYEESTLKIDILETTEYSNIFNVKDHEEELPEYLKHLELETFNYTKIILFEPDENIELTKTQRIIE